MKRSQLKANPKKVKAWKQRSKPLKASKGLSRTKKPAGAKNKPRKGKISDRWVKAIPESQSHGAGTYQKRLWRLVSDYVRIRDWHKYGVCVATGTRIERWQDGHAGHLKPYTGCNALYKFDVRNIHMQHGNSNKFGNYDTFRKFEKVVRNRGYDFDAFERENNKANGARLYDHEVRDQMKVMLHKMADLPEQPAYYNRAMELLSTDTPE